MTHRAPIPSIFGSILILGMPDANKNMPVS
jgi:hypothetical protein